MHSIIDHPNYKIKALIYGQKIMEVCSWHNLIRERGALSEGLRVQLLRTSSTNSFFGVVF